jgi:hypothetical protein
MSVAAWIVVGLLVWIVAMLVFWAFIHSATRLDKAQETKMTIDTYFVKNGLLNGEAGVFAIPAGDGSDPPQQDGWYWLPIDATDGKGPFTTKEEAEAAAIEVLTRDR